jgi:2-dehydro-3-deoxyphosphogluconate aldolase/(4S)-4-hydroxy-2-oxoglutarate aldolase
MGNGAEQTADRLFKDNLIAVVPGLYEISDLLRIGDALLAAPILSMLITTNSSNALDGINLLRQRFGEHMLIGADSVRTVKHAAIAVAAGAQFLLAPRLNLAVAEYAARRDVLYAPGVFTAQELASAQAANCSVVTFHASISHGPETLRGLTACAGSVRIIGRGNVNEDNITRFAAAGAAAVCLSGTLITGPDQPMHKLIRRARELRDRWEATQRS